MSHIHPFILFLLVCILTIVSIILYKVWDEKSNYLYPNQINLLQWNTHYECFVKNKNDCCTKPLISYLNKMIPRTDFANISMFEKTGYTPPSGYTTIDQFSAKPAFECGQDITTLIYNSKKWKAVSKPIYGCLVPNDRAFIVQRFENKTTGYKVVIIGAHFSHPAQGQSYPSDSTAMISKTLQEHGISDESDHIILLADTNDNFPDKPTPDEVFMKAIVGQKTKHNIVGSGPKQTCCCSDSPNPTPFPYKTDRIISNRGTSKGKAVIPELTDIFGSIAKCPPPPGSTGGCVFGEMHRPVFWAVGIDTV